MSLCADYWSLTMGEFRDPVVGLPFFCAFFQFVGVPRLICSLSFLLPELLATRTLVGVCWILVLCERALARRHLPSLVISRRSTLSDFIRLPLYHHDTVQDNRNTTLFAFSDDAFRLLQH